MMKWLRSLSTLLVIAYLLPLATAGAKGIRVEEQVAMPVAEAVFRIERWLKLSDLEVDRKNMSDHTVRLVGSNSADDTTRWQVDVRPQSALAAKILVEIDGPEAADEQAKQLIDALRQSADETQSPAGEEERVISEPVLGQIGNVACIHVQSQGRVVQFTGFFIDGDGLVLSTAHDLKEHERVSIMSNVGIPYEGTIIKADFARDLALIKVDAKREGIINVAEGRNLLTMGETVFSIGCPIDLRGTVESGFINGPPRKISTEMAWQVHMTIQPGSSGSPVFDNSGAFIGVVKGRHRETEDIGFLIPLEVVIDFLKEYFSQ